MANTFSQISIQIIFAVKGRENFITKNFRDRLHSYIAGIITKTGQKTLAVNGYKDHIHAFFGMESSVSVSDIAKAIKANSSRWINEQGFVPGKFRWQEGFGAFSYSKSQRDSVIKYILNQEQHHQRKTFRAEYLEMLRCSEILYDERYLFEFYE